MPKPLALPMLNLSATRKEDARSNNPLSPRSLTSAHSPRSVPGSPLLNSPNMVHPLAMGEKGENGNGPVSPRITAIPGIPSSPEKDANSNSKESSKSFFSNLMASKSSHKLQSNETIVHETEKPNGRSRGNSRDRSNYELQTKSSKPELPRMTINNGKASNEFQDESLNNSIPPESSDGNSVTQKKSRSKLGGILGRTKATKMEEENKKKTASPTQLNLDTSASHNGHVDNLGPALKTAPLKADHRERTFGDTNGSSARTRSADRSREDIAASRKTGVSAPMAPSSLKESSMFQGIQTTSKGVSDRWGKAGKGFFSKITRSGSNTEREVPSVESYVCTTINLPLVEQTRKTRIAKRLELSRDKTEFWMPALPWRCIDYLNMNGCEEEGLYRIPGSGREVKLWQKRFDTEFDINLFDEPDLYDINTIGSMFKSWLRELPDEILPKATQAKISRVCHGSTTTPQLLKDELSRLPPFNYYLLFAITCHLSLLHSFSDKNKMDYRNLCICFQPCLKIDPFCFQFLVINWKDCWQGCWTEHEYLQEEYRGNKDGSTLVRKPDSIDERAISSSSSSQAPPPSFQQQPRSAETGVQRKNSAPSSYHKARNPSLGNHPTHANSPSLPTVPHAAMTPEQKKIPEQELPELGSLSPIRM